jgi:hypothetical protein
MPPLAAAAPIIGAVGGLASAGVGIANAIGGGGGGGATSGTPGTNQAYVPQNQPGADQAFNNIVQSLISQYQTPTAAGQPGSLPPQLYQPSYDVLAATSQNLGGQAGGLTQNIVNNPFYTDQLTSALDALGYVQDQYGNLRNQYSTAASTAVPGMINEANILDQIRQAISGYAGQTAGLAPWLTDLSQQAGAGIAPTQALAGTVAGTMPQYQAIAQKIGGYMDPLAAGASTLLQTGYDPQSALFNRLTQQTRDQSQAMEAMSGLAGTPYAAGLTSDALRNLDIDWQNQQLQRQATALAGAGTAFGQAGTLGGEVANVLTGMGGQATTAGGLYGSAADQAARAGTLQLQGAQTLTDAANQQAQARAAATAGADIYNLLPGAAAASTQGLAGLTNLEMAAKGLPAQTYQTQQQTGFDALTNQQQMISSVASNLNNAVANGQISLSDAQGILNNLTNYLGLGRQASLAAGELGQTAINQQTQALRGLTALPNQISTGLNQLSTAFGDSGTPSAFSSPSAVDLGNLSTQPIPSYGGLSFQDLQDLGVVPANA